MSSSALGSAARPPLGQRLKRAALLSLLGLAAATAGTYWAYATPACDSGTAQDLLRQAFGASQFAQTNRLQAVQLQAPAGVGYSFGDAQRQCTGTLLLTNTARMDIRYTLTGTHWDGVTVELERAR